MKFDIIFHSKLAGRGVYITANGNFLFLRTPIKQGEFWSYEASTLSRWKLVRWFQIVYYRIVD